SAGEAGVAAGWAVTSRTCTLADSNSRLSPSSKFPTRLRSSLIMAHLLLSNPVEKNRGHLGLPTPCDAFLGGVPSVEGFPHCRESAAVDKRIPRIVAESPCHGMTTLSSLQRESS